MWVEENFSVEIKLFFLIKKGEAWGKKLSCILINGAPTRTLDNDDLLLAIKKIKSLFDAMALHIKKILIASFLKNGKLGEIIKSKIMEHFKFI